MRTRIATPSAPDDRERERFSTIVDRATRVDGQPPFSDQAMVDSRTGSRLMLTEEYDGVTAGVALVSVGDGPVEAELVVDPDARRHGVGGRLLERVLGQTTGELAIWAHGDHPGARALARRHGLVAARELLQLRMELDPEDAGVSTGSTNGTGVSTSSTNGDNGGGVSVFRPGVDDAEWLNLNALAFASHPEQGRLTQRDLDARLAETWFDADDFLLTRSPDGTLSGFCWLKVEHDIGEFYAVGVSPDAQGAGIGRLLVDAGVARLASRGIRTASLYVEADNLPAVSLYRSVGFTNHTIDIQYRSHGS